MGNVNMEASQVHVRDNSHKTWGTVADAIAALDNQDTMVQEDITELYTRDASRASKDDITNEFSDETTYHIGDYAYYNGTLFKFIANHSGEWDPDDVIIAQIGTDIANAGAIADFSTTEQPTGQKWIDGKEIYFRSYDVQLPAAHDADTNLAYLIAADVSYIDTLTRVDGSIYDSTGKCSALNGGLSYVAGWRYNVHITATHALELFNGQNQTDIGGGRAVLTIYYTKVD